MENKFNTEVTDEAESEGVTKGLKTLKENNPIPATSKEQTQGLQ